ncbi:two-component system response regulator YehT [Escherichia coli]|nr:two-component system response regulator YehT [Escherichia coli]
MCVFLVIAWLMSKTPLFIPLMQVTVRLPHKFLCYIVFSIFCIMGTWFGLHIDDSIANTRAIGAVMGGLLGGPVVGGLVGLTGGLHRYSMGGMTALSCMISTIVEGLLGGLVHSILIRRGRTDKVFNPITAGAVTFVAEMVQMLIILAIARPYEDAVRLVSNIAAPMMVTNTVGAALFMRILLDKRAMFEKYTSAFSATALKVAASTEGILRQGFNEVNSMKVAQVLYQELDIGAVAITDREKLLAFTGIGDDHHLPGKPISSTYTLKAIETGEVVYADGNEVPYRCSLHPQCKLGSTLVIPLRGENQRVMGTIKLYEAKNRLFSSINRTLGEGIAQLLSAQILAGQYERQKAMLTQSEIKLLRRDSEQASQLVQYLSTFFRKNLKRPSEFVTLADEIEHVNAYLQIEKARFQSRLQVNIAIPQELSQQQLPAFTLQPIVENAIKHGTSQLLDTGRVAISARREGQHLMLEIEDNAGLYQPVTNASGLGMNLVDKRLRERFGDDYGISVACEPDSYTRITLRLPLIVDDEPLARENLRVFLQEQSDIEIVGECSNAVEGIGAVHKLRPDVLFLDIQMPRISGLEMVGMLDPEHRPYIVFLTAFDEYAIKAFEEHAFDYLLKPIDEARLEKTLARLRQERSKQDVSLLPENQQALKFIPCTGHSRIYLLQMKDVAFVSSRMSGVYVTSHEGKEGFTELTLRTLESRTPLLRCHRQYLVNLAHLQEIRLEDNGQAELILRNGLTVPVSRRYLKSLKEAIGL